MDATNKVAARGRPIVNALLIEALFFAAFLTLIVGAHRDRLFYDPGTLWHTKVGELILRGGFFTADPFSYTKAGAEWIPSNWLAEVVMAALHRLAGLDGLLWGGAVLLAGLFAWIGNRAVAVGHHPLVAALLVALAFMASCYHFHLRTHLATLVLLPTAVALLLDIERGRRPRRALWWLVPLAILWANAHGGVLAGYGAVGFVFLGWIVGWRFGRPTPVNAWRDVGLLAAVAAALALTPLANPYGVGLPRMWHRVMQADLPQIIAEHAPMTLRSPIGCASLAVLAVYLAVAVGVRPRDVRATWLLPVAFFALALSRVRHGPLFALTTITVVADMLGHCRWWLCLGRHSELLRTDSAEADSRGQRSPWAIGWARPTVYAGVLCCFLAVPVSRGWAQLDPNHWPTALLPSLRDWANAVGERGRVFNDDRLGGFIIYFLPGTPVFIDDRCELYGKDLLLEYVAALRDPAQLGRWIEQYGIDAALIPKDGPFARWLRTRPDWHETTAPGPASFFRYSPRANGKPD